MRRARLLAGVVVCGVVSAVWAQGEASPAADRVEYVRVGHLFDSVAGRYRDNVVLVVAGERVRSVEPAGFAIPAGARVVDLSGDYVLPGLIDCHTHLGARADSTTRSTRSWRRRLLRRMRV